MIKNKHINIYIYFSNYIYLLYIYCLSSINNIYNIYIFIQSFIFFYYLVGFYPRSGRIILV